MGMSNSVSEMHFSGSAVSCVTLSFKNWSPIQHPGQLTHGTVLKLLCFVSLILTHCCHASCQTYRFVKGLKESLEEVWHMKESLW